MKPRECILSVFFLAFIGVKLAEGLLQIESWPLTHTPMFAEYKGPERSPMRVLLLGKRHGATSVLDPATFALADSEVEHQLRDRLTATGSFAAACRGLGRSLNERLSASRKLDTLTIRLEWVGRPGMEAPREPLEIPCSLHTATE